MPGGVGGAGVSPAPTRFDAAAGGNQTSRQDRAAQAPPADPTATRSDETPATREKGVSTLVACWGPGAAREGTP